ncbi:hypothetical protein N7486_009740 [Penicillium sp. IBT 16267x]|nr:hypothetical protein N7486_009740 [Penicillium sp. IBT 16267x]
MATTRSKVRPPENQANADSTQITDHQIRTIIKSQHPSWRSYPEVFYTTGGVWNGKLKVPFYPVVLATNQNGIRYLSDACLEQALPRWKDYLNPKRAAKLPRRQDIWNSAWYDWVKKENEKLKGLGLSWPSKHVPALIQNMGDPQAPTERLIASNRHDRGSKRVYPDEDIRSTVPNKRSTGPLERPNGLGESGISFESVLSDEEMGLVPSEAPSS